MYTWSETSPPTSLYAATSSHAAPGSGTRVVVYGHSHKALVAKRDGVLWVNPGAAGRVGFHREVTLAFLRVEHGRCEAKLVLLGPRRVSSTRRNRQANERSGGVEAESSQSPLG